MNQINELIQYLPKGLVELATVGLRREMRLARHPIGSISPGDKGWRWTVSGTVAVQYTNGKSYGKLSLHNIYLTIKRVLHSEQ